MYLPVGQRWTGQDPAWLQANEDYAARQREAQGAEERAVKLLKARLGSYRYRMFQFTGVLFRRSKLWPGIVYLVRSGHTVLVVERGRVKTELCVVAGQGEPEADRIMSILDLIETNEEELWAMANVFPK